MQRPADTYWYNLKDRVKSRAHFLSWGRCEFCWLRNYYALHHRTYDREGQELPEDVMLVCNICHELIHGLRGSMPGTGSEVKVRIESLAMRGDRGMTPWGLDGPYGQPLWKTYVEQWAQELKRQSSMHIKIYSKLPEWQQELFNRFGIG